MDIKRMRPIALIVTLIMLVSVFPVECFAASNAYKTTLSEAAVKCRTALCNRYVQTDSKKHFDVTVCYSSSEFYNTSDKQLQLINDATNEVFRHTGKPYEGDYLEYTVKEFKYATIQILKHSENNYYYLLPFTVAYMNSAEEQKLIQNAISEFIESCDFTSMDTDYYKVCKAYDYVLNNWKNETRFDSLNILGETQKKALILYAVCNSVGVDCRVVSDGSDAWNIVSVEGNMYNIDVSNEKFLVSDANIGKTRDANGRLLPSCDADCVYEEANIKLTASNDEKTGNNVLTWSRIPNVSEYEVYKRKEGTEYELCTVTSRGTYTDSGNKAGVRHFYIVKPVQDNGNDFTSEEISRSANLAKPVIKAYKKRGYIKLTWKKVPGAKKYYIYKSKHKNKGFSKVNTVSKRHYNDYKVKRGRKYYYKVVAVPPSGKCKSAFSNTVSKRR